MVMFGHAYKVMYGYVWSRMIFSGHVRSSWDSIGKIGNKSNAENLGEKGNVGNIGNKAFLRKIRNRQDRVN